MGVRNKETGLVENLSKNISKFAQLFINNLKIIQEKLNSCEAKNKEVYSRGNDKEYLKLLLEYHDQLEESAEMITPDG